MNAPQLPTVPVWTVIPGYQDIVYAKGNPIQVERADIVHPDGRRVTVIAHGEYLI